MIIKGGPEGAEIRVWIATPCYGMKPDGDYLLALFQTLPVLATMGIRFAYQLESDSLVTRIRNCMVASMLAEPEQWTHFCFIDSDIAWQPEALLRLIDADHDVSCVSYPVKEKATRFVLNLIEGDKEDLCIDQKSGFVRVKEGGTGFMLIKREALEFLIAMHPELKCIFGFHMTPEQERLSYALFDTAIEPGTGRYLSEDYQFCRLWREAGGTVWLDPYSELRHFGGATFAGRVADVLAKIDPEWDRKTEQQTQEVLTK